MNEDNIESEETFLLRSKLHFRCGIRRLNQKKYSAGLATIYDALISGMLLFASSPKRIKGYKIPSGEDL